MRSLHLKFIFTFCLLPISVQSQGRCQTWQKSDLDAAVKQSTFKDRTLIATASWCSSCKPHLQHAATDPEKYVILTAFDDVAETENVLQKFNVVSPCISSEAWVERLAVKSLPFSCELDSELKCVYKQ